MTLAERSATEVSFTRTFGAPRALVFQAWTEAKRLAQWWGPKQFTTSVREADARPGGALFLVMRAPDGTDYPMRGVFDEVIAPERLVFTTQALDAEGQAVLESRTVVTFTERDGATEVRVEARAVALTEIAAHYLAGMEEGWSQTLDRLGDHLGHGRGYETPG